MTKNASKTRQFQYFAITAWGGVISHELGIQFRSPTVNLWMKPNDYINFLSNPKYYLSIEPVQIETDRGYPVGKIDDITLFFQHYKTFDDVIGKWKERTKRIQWDNLAVIFIYLTESNDELIEKFLVLPYKNKAVLSFYDDTKNGIYEMKKAYIANKTKGTELAGLCNYRHRFTGIRWLDDFDFVSFLNGCI